MHRDYTALAGIGIALAAVAGGFALEHGQIRDLISLNSLVIVAGGTIGAILIGTPGFAISSAFRRCRGMFRRRTDQPQAIAERILRCAALVRRAGVGSIEPEAESVKHGFLGRALLLVLDGQAPAEVRRQLETDIAKEEESVEADARVFEQAGGYAPTIGIIGAVVGLIQVMKQFGNVDEVGRGIATAFVSTLYGVAFANLVLLPLATRIRACAQAENYLKVLVLEGVTAIAERQSLHVVRARLDTCLGGRTISTAPAPRAIGKTA
jgi:chemotaxis protein MotA